MIKPIANIHLLKVLMIIQTLKNLLILQMAKVLREEKKIPQDRAKIIIKVETLHKRNLNMIKMEIL